MGVDDGLVEMGCWSCGGGMMSVGWDDGPWRWDGDGPWGLDTGP